MIATRHSLPTAGRTTPRRRDRGIALIWVAITFVVLLGLVGLALDTARVLLTAHELQNAADAAALAGVRLVRTNVEQARLAARTIAAANTAENVSVTVPDNPDNDETGRIVIGRFDRETLTFEATLTAPNAVKVIAGRTSGQNGSLPLIFGPIFNVSTADIQRQAIAMVGGGTGAGLIALDPNDKGALTIDGTVTLDLDGGGMVVNSNDTQALITNGTPDIQAPAINIYGDADNTTYQVYDGEINPGTPPTPDPLAYLTAPNWASMSNYGTISVTGSSSTTVSLTPGYYPGGISMSNNNGQLNLAPGIYVLDGAGLNITGGNMNAYGVMFYIKGDGVVNLTGNGTVNITGIDPSLYSYSAGVEVYEGISIFQDSPLGVKPANKTDSKIVGTSLLNLGGTLYFRSNHLNLSGTSAGVGNQLIANTIKISGTGTITINYDGRNPAAGNRVYLVE